MDDTRGANKFQDLILLSDTTKSVYALVTYRIDEYGRKLYSFSLSRGYQDKEAGELKRTSWLHPRNVGALRELLAEVDRFIREDEQKYKASRLG